MPSFTFAIIKVNFPQNPLHRSKILMFIFVGNYTDNENEPYFRTEKYRANYIQTKNQSLSERYGKFSIQSEKVFLSVFVYKEK